jgi:hypothetical protein
MSCDDHGGENSIGENSLRQKLARFKGREWDEACRKMQVLLMNGRRDLAALVLNQFAAGNVEHTVTLDDKVSGFLPVRVGNALEDAGYVTFRSVKNATDEELYAIKCFGSKTIIRLREAVKQIELGKFVIVDDEQIESWKEKKGQ